MIADYFTDLKQQLIICSSVISFKVIKEFYGSNDGFIRIKCRIESGTELEFAEYVQIVRGNQIHRETYSYHWQTRNRRLIKRWDNAPHHKELSTFPDHLHDGEQVRESKPVSLERFACAAVFSAIFPLSAFGTGCCRALARRKIF